MPYELVDIFGMAFAYCQVQTGVTLLCVLLKGVQTSVEQVFEDVDVTLESGEVEKRGAGATHDGLNLVFEIVWVLALHNVLVDVVISTVDCILDRSHTLI